MTEVGGRIRRVVTIVIGGVPREVEVSRQDYRLGPEARRYEEWISAYLTTRRGWAWRKNIIAAATEVGLYRTTVDEVLVRSGRFGFFQMINSRTGRPSREKIWVYISETVGAQAEIVPPTE